MKLIVPTQVKIDYGWIKSVRRWEVEGMLDEVRSAVNEWEYKQSAAFRVFRKVTPWV